MSGGSCWGWRLGSHEHWASSPASLLALNAATARHCCLTCGKWTILRQRIGMLVSLPFLKSAVATSGYRDNDYG